MYILIAGRHPFDMDPGADESELERHICQGEPDFSDELWSHVSPDAIDLIKWMLSKVRCVVCYSYCCKNALSLLPLRV
jgi:hypothetical protein